MNQSQLIHSAKQRDTSAIIALLNQSLSLRRIEIAEATIEEDSLSLKLQSRRIPNQHKIVPFLTEELKTLKIESIERVTVYGHSEESPQPAWEETIALTGDCSIANFVTRMEARPTVEEPIGEISEEEENPEVSEASSEEEVEEPTETTDTAEETDESAEEEERTIPSRYALPTPTATVSPSSFVPLAVALAVGFGLGMMAGMFFGYQKAVSDSAANPTIPSTPTGTIEPPR